MSAHQVTWLDEQCTILCERYTGQLHLDEYLPVLERGATMIRMQDHPVDIVIDVRGLHISQMREFFAVVRYVTSKVPPNQRRVVVCADRPFVQALADATSSIALKTMATIRFFEAIEEALIYLKQKRETTCKIG